MVIVLFSPLVFIEKIVYFIFQNTQTKGYFYSNYKKILRISVAMYIHFESSKIKLSHDIKITIIRNSRPQCSVKKVLLQISQNSQGKICAVAGLRPQAFLKKETLAQVFSCKFCEISKNIFPYRTPPVTASVKT